MPLIVVSSFFEDAAALAHPLSPPVHPPCRCRELKEELGFGRPGAPLTFLYSCLVSTAYNRCFVDVFQYALQPGEAQEDVALDPEEVQWGALVALEEVKARVAKNSQPGEWTWVPDGLLVWEEQLRYWEREGTKR